MNCLSLYNGMMSVSAKFYFLWMFDILMKIRSLLRNIFDSSSLLHAIYIRLKVIRVRFKVKHILAILSKSGCDVIDLRDLKNMVLSKFSTPQNTNCHIIGSGWSLNQSKAVIKKDDCVIGFNQAALSGLDFDLYFFEFGGDKVDDISKQQIKLFDKLLGKKPIIVFKNVWEDKNDVDYIVKYWGSKLYYIHDYAVPCMSKKNLVQSIGYMLNSDDKYLRQYMSSVITSIGFAAYCGFKTIVIHGLDFGGEYFFDADDFDGDNSLRPDSNRALGLYEKCSSSSVHSTSVGSIGVKSSIPIIRDLLKQSGVTIFSASRVSPLSEYLPIYEKKAVK